MAKKPNGKDVEKRTEAMTPDLARGLFDMRKNLEGIIPRLPQIRMMHGESQLFKMPDEEMVKGFEVIILDFNRCNAFWSVPFSESGGGTPPDCSSLDSLSLDPMSEEPQSTTGKCKDCPMNAFGSDTKSEDSKGKACKNMMRIHLLFPGQLIPFRITIPPTSLKVMDEYIPLIASKGLPYQLVRSKFSLAQDKNKKGIKYSKLVLEMGEPVQTVEEAHAIKQFVDEWKTLMRTEEILSNEYAGDE